MSRQRLVVIGGDAAGMSGASQARRGAKDMQIVALEKGGYVSYAACGIPYYIGGAVDSLSQLVVRTPEEFQRRQDIEVRLRHEAVQIRPDDKKVVVRDLEAGREYEEPYDHLLIATGAKAVRPDLPGMDAEGVFTVTRLGDADALRRILEEKKPEHVVIVGGGYVGLELADSFRRWDVDVSLVARSPRLLRSLDPDMAELVAEGMEETGVHVYRGEAATGFEVVDGHVAAVVTTERTLSTDLVIVAAGVAPNTDLARDAGLPLGLKDTIKVDDHMRTPLPDVWAAGDCVETVQLVTGLPYWTSLATVANKQGRVAGVNIAGGDMAFPGTYGTTITRSGVTEISHTGLSETDLTGGDIEFAVAKANYLTASRYYPGAAAMTVKLLAEVGSGRLLGAQIVGGAGAAARINILVTALQAQMTVDDIAALDLAYAPPFSPVFDPILLAARNLCRKC